MMKSIGTENPCKVRKLADNRWDAVESVDPDEIDMQMIREAQADPDCSTFASDSEIREVLG